MKISLARTFVYFFIIWFALTLILATKIPSAYKRIYAEDGVSLQQSLESSFPNELFEPMSGYLDFLLRVIASIVSIFPLEFASLIFFGANTLFLAILWASVYISSINLFKNRRWRFFAATSLILIPIGNFESLANAANLHFYFMSASLVVILAQPRNGLEAFLLSSIVFLAATSIPLMILTFPLVITRLSLSQFRPKNVKDKTIILSWILGNSIQAFFIMTTSLGERKSTSVNSISEVAYLYLDRVVGSSLIPFWGFVSTSTQLPFPHLFNKTTFLLIRAIFTICMIMLFLILIKRVSGLTSTQNRMCFVVVFTGIFQWIFVGLLFNPEPRYAIFPSFSLLIALFYAVQHKSAQNLRLDLLVIILVVLTWVGSWAPSKIRTEGPYWNTELKKARATCFGVAQKVSIPISPNSSSWQITIDCNYVLNSD